MKFWKSSRWLGVFTAVMLLLSACGQDGNQAALDTTTNAPAGADANTAPAPDTTTNANTAPDAAIDAGASGWTGTITMYAQSYTPNQRDATTPLTAFREIADQYEQAHPGITIQFIDEEFQSYNDIVRTKAASGELYDVYWAQWNALNGTLPQGIAVDLSPYLTEKNPYITDAATWQDAMNENVVNETAAPSGAHYNINGDFVATAFFYDKAMFDKAGIAEPPKTWPDLLATAQKLKDAGVPVMAHVPYFGWWQRHFLSDFYANEYDTLAGYDGQPGQSALDEVCAINAGLLSTKDPRFMGWWPLFKQFTDYWIPDYITQSPDQQDAAFQDFVGGRAAMMYEGSWTPNKLRDANVPFEFESFSFPPLGEDVTPFSTGADSSNAVGGPNAGFQFAIATPEANKTMQEPGKPEAVLDWLRFIGTPQNVEKVVNELGNFLPTWKGTEPNSSVELLTEQANQPLRSIQIGSASTILSPDADIQRIFGLYLSGNSTIEQASADMQQLLDRAVQDYQTKNNVDLATACK